VVEAAIRGRRWGYEWFAFIGENTCDKERIAVPGDVVLQREEEKGEIHSAEGE